ncbi:hypothetical protein M0802_006289 [Mischocyttarus mexicanus]|nr:hypothetical protein M0802_006289 [Mischocyttarus mexicanus]
MRIFQSRVRSWQLRLRPSRYAIKTADPGDGNPLGISLCHLRIRWMRLKSIPDATFSLVYTRGYSRATGKFSQVAPNQDWNSNRSYPCMGSGTSMVFTLSSVQESSLNE